MKRITGLLCIAFVVLVGCKTSLPDIETWRISETDPVLAVGHGAIFDASGKEIDPTPAFTIEAQRFYLKSIYQRSKPQQRARFNDLQKNLQEAQPQSDAERIVMNAALLAWLNDATKTEGAAHAASKNAALLSRFARLRDGELVATGDLAGVIRREFLGVLQRQGMLKFLSATLAGGREYVEECRKAGVPIPPDWGSPNWQSRGLLTTKFISAGIDAEVFAFESEAPRGVCFALPRSQGNTISLLGIICLGTDTSKSCFWDNQRNKMQFPIQKNTAVPLSDFAGGADLAGGTGGVCTDCHAGENPFVVHPARPMDLGAKIIPKGWQSPMVHPSWPQNPGPNTVLPGIVLKAGEDSCLSCHNRPPGVRFPEVSTELPGYCGIILPKAISTTMPPGSPGNNATYARHKDALLNACRQPPSSGVVINGATQSTPASSRSDTTGDLTACAPGGDCPLGFCYWKTLHGPFWQTTPSTIPVGDAAYRGSFLRIFAEAGKWKWRAFSDPTGGPPNAPPGGTAECIAYNQIASVPDPQNCFANMFSVHDPVGNNFAQTVDATVSGSTANVLSGFIGNVAQANVDRPDRLQVYEASGKVLLEQTHTSTPPTPIRLGPLTGESWTNGCNAWTPIYEAKDVRSESDVQLVPAAQADNVRCYITGMTGAWSTTRNNATEQPFAEIYKGPGGDVRLRVSPVEGKDRVGAFASCIRLN